MKRLFEKIELQLLMNLTAAAFGQRPLRTWTQPHAAALSTYAACTREWMRSATGAREDLQEALFRRSLRMGRLLRRLTFFLGDAGHAWLVLALYKGIGIDMRGMLPGDVQVTSCFFSQAYTPDMCALISAMDDGIVSGIMGGGRLVFTQRITEGCGSCRACLTRSEKHVE